MKIPRYQPLQNYMMNLNKRNIFLRRHTRRDYKIGKQIKILEVCNDEIDNDLDGIIDEEHQGHNK
jgi:hypothetical protein